MEFCNILGNHSYSLTLLWLKFYKIVLGKLKNTTAWKKCCSVIVVFQSERRHLQEKDNTILAIEKRVEEVIQWFGVQE